MLVLKTELLTEEKLQCWFMVLEPQNPRLGRSIGSASGGGVLVGRVPTQQHRGPRVKKAMCFGVYAAPLKSHQD